MENTSSHMAHRNPVPENVRRHLVALLADGACDDWALTAHKSGDDTDFETIVFSITPHTEKYVKYSISLHNLIYGIQNLAEDVNDEISGYAAATISLMNAGQAEFLGDGHVSAMVQGAVYGTLRHPVDKEM